MNSNDLNIKHSLARERHVVDVVCVADVNVVVVVSVVFVAVVIGVGSNHGCVAVAFYVPQVFATPPC